MPSISVPLKGEPGWDVLMRQRREFWRKPGNNQLTPNFKATEFYCNDGSACPINARPAMLRLARDYLEPMRKKFGECFILSGYRHVLYNARVGGARLSQHIYEYSYENVATDVRFAKGNPTQWGAEAKRIRTRLGKGGGIGVYVVQGFIHIDNRSYVANWTGKGE